MIQKLENFKSNEYLELKEHILSNDFPWYYNSISTPSLEQNNHVNTPFYGHTFIRRPEDEEGKYPRAYSSSVDWVTRVCLSILNANQIKINSFLRINANCTHPEKKVVNSVPHQDHYYDHTNLILYLTAAGGETIVEGEEYSPLEDDAIVFKGEHYMRTPKKDRRIILIATFI